MFDLFDNLSRPPIAMAPLAGITDSAFRQLCKNFGADLLWTEMVNATGLFYKRKKISEWLKLQVPDASGQCPVAPPPLRLRRAGSCQLPEESKDSSYQTSEPGVFRDTDFEQVQQVIPGKIPGEVNILRYSSCEQPLVVQLFGKEPEHFKIAAELVSRMGFAGIDINMGCPARKVVNSFHGCSLMRDAGLAKAIVQAVSEGANKYEILNPKSETNSKFEIRNLKHISTIPVSVKIRSGWDEVIAPEFARAMQEAGADIITIHARTKQQGFKGKADWDVIRQVVQSVDIPVIGNGDVVDGDSALAMLEQTGCAGIMVGRAAIGKPWLFAEIRDKIQRYTEEKVRKVKGKKQAVISETCPSGKRVRNQNLETSPKHENRNSKQIPNSKFQILNSSFGHFDDLALDTAYEHCRLLVKMKGEARGMTEARKHLAWYIKGFPGSAELRARLVRVERLEEVREILEKGFGIV